MARVLLINPPSPERLGAPLLGQQYVAAALLARGCEVKVIDAAARHFPHDSDWIVEQTERFAPHIVGMGLFTRWVWHAYRLAERLRGRFPLLVAGGPHATVRADETLRHGFDVAVIGEGELTIGELVEVIEGRRALADVGGIRYRAAGGEILSGRDTSFIDDLDRLASPLLAQDLYDPAWYDDSGDERVPGGLLTSRGCPARCTFCANYVTGRGFRYRSPANVVAELNAYHRRSGLRFFPFWDDALTTNRRRLRELCEALARDVAFPLGWSAITRASQVNPEMLAAMKRAGLIAVNFGVESGDDEVLRAIKKGVTTDQVVRALEWSKAAGLRTAANFMLGFPQEDSTALERTLAFMQRIAPLVDSFSTLGVLIPYPGTPLYEEYHQHYGFTDWWLKERYSRWEEAPPIEAFDDYYRYYIDDQALALDFFRYDRERRDLIRECLRFKAEHNLRAGGLLPSVGGGSPTTRKEPARASNF
ncbi:MAG: radical SAM protein [Gammaproteobacteria bacterium]